MYFLSERLIAKIGEIRVLYIGLICYSIRLFYYSVLPYPWLVLVVELLPGITTAAVWAACLSYVSINSRPGAQTTMQCILHSVHWGLGYGAGEVIGGILVHHYGAPKTFILFGVLCIVILLVYILVRFVWGKSEAQMLRENELHSRGEGKVDEAAEEAVDEAENLPEKQLPPGEENLLPEKSANLLDIEDVLSDNNVPPSGAEKSNIDDATPTQESIEQQEEQTQQAAEQTQQQQQEQPPEKLTLNDGKPILLSVDK